MAVLERTAAAQGDSEVLMAAVTSEPLTVATAVAARDWDSRCVGALSTEHER